MEKESPKFPGINVFHSRIIPNILDEEHRVLDMSHFVTWKALSNEIFLTY